MPIHILGVIVLRVCVQVEVTAGKASQDFPDRREVRNAGSSTSLLCKPPVDFILPSLTLALMPSGPGAGVPLRCPDIGRMWQISANARPGRMVCKAGPLLREKPLWLRSGRASGLEGELGSALADTQPHRCFRGASIGKCRQVGNSLDRCCHSPELSLVAEMFYAMLSCATEHLERGSCARETEF